MKAVLVNNGIVHINESKAICPHCTKGFKVEEFEDAWYKSKSPIIRKKCKGCKRFVGITTDMKGDFIAFELSSNKSTEI